MSKNKFLIYSFYKFKKIECKERIKIKLDKFLSKKLIKGTILLADEGINASISSTKDDLNEILKYIKGLINVRKIEIKCHQTSFLPFNKIKVRLKREIVTLGQNEIDITKHKSTYATPEIWNEIIQDTSTAVLDVRNSFEIDIGKFKRSIDPKTKSFRDFPNQVKNLNLDKNKKIAIYCTGGIRCEKASAFLKHHGYRNVIQLQGGILNYINYLKNNNMKSLWKGECFVFDDRVSINLKEKTGKYIQCYGCRSPILKKDKKSRHYIHGVQCHKCYNRRSYQQIKKSVTRQMQINNAELNNEYHPFKKIYSE